MSKPHVLTRRENAVGVMTFNCPESMELRHNSCKIIPVGPKPMQPNNGSCRIRARFNFNMRQKIRHNLHFTDPLRSGWIPSSLTTC